MEAVQKKYTNSRKYIRFKPDDLDIAYVMLNTPDADDFKPDLSALIIDEAHKGCSVAVLPAKEINEDTIIYIKVGKLPPLKAQIKWKKSLDGVLDRLGIMYLE